MDAIIPVRCIYLPHMPTSPLIPCTTTVHDTGWESRFTQRISIRSGPGLQILQGDLPTLSRPPRPLFLSFMY